MLRRPAAEDSALLLAAEPTVHGGQARGHAQGMSQPRWRQVSRSTGCAAREHQGSGSIFGGILSFCSISQASSSSAWCS